MRLIRVFLPQPEGPTITLSLPASTTKEAPSTTSWRAHTSPNILVTSRHSTRPSTFPAGITPLRSRGSEQPPPWGEVDAQAPYHGAADGASNAHAAHADDHLRNVTGGVRLPGEKADPRASGDHLGRDQHHPRDPHSHGGARDDGRQRAGEDDSPEDVAA